MVKSAGITTSLCSSANVFDFALEFAIEYGHHGNHQTPHPDPERHAENRNDRDDPEKGALRFQIPEREKKTKRQFQIGDTVPVNSRFSNKETARGCRSRNLTPAKSVPPASGAAARLDMLVTERNS